MSAIAGTRGRISIGGAAVSLNKWELEFSATEVEANDFESDEKQYVYGLKSASVSLSGYFDEAVNIHNVNGVKVGTDLTNVQAYLVKGGLVYTFATLKVFGISVSDEADGKADITISGKCNGAWTYPDAVAS